METFIPAGTNVTLFGQLPNRRWRCLVEFDELIKTMNGLVEELDREAETLEANTNTTDALKNIGIHNAASLENIRNNIPTYPLMGSLPTSVLHFDFDEIRASGTPTSDRDEPEYEDPIKSPYSSHKRENRKTPLKPIFDDIQIIDLENENINFTTARDSSTITEESNFEDVSSSGNTGEEADDDSDAESVYDNVSTEERSFLRSRAGSGIIISKKLRQKGISIIVGSSSSEDEDDGEENENSPVVTKNNKNDNNNNNNNNNIKNKLKNSVYRKFNHSSSRGQENEWSNEDGNYIRSKYKHKDLKQSCSLDQIDGEFSTKTDLLKRFGQKSIHLSKDKDLAKAVLELFDKQKGPDVKPPRNERRTLKLHKTETDGFGFWLQTYGFPKNSGNVQKRTFVRYVEDEGSAYMAGLREGDIIVEIDDEPVEEYEHTKIVDLIINAKTQLRLVVKFIDAVHRVELNVRLKKKNALLKTKMEELEKLKMEEENLLNGNKLSASYDTIDSACSRDDDDDASIHTSTESEISSIASSQSDELVVRTSKFANRSSRVLDSIKELNCNDNASSFSISDLNRVSTTTEDELLTLYCEKLDYHNSLPRTSGGNRLKRVESMPVQKYHTLPRKRVIDLDNGTYAREYAIDTITNERHLQAFGYEGSDSSDDCSSSQSSVGPSPLQDLDRISRTNRPKSYKLAMTSLKNLEGDVDEV